MSINKATLHYLSILEGALGHMSALADLICAWNEWDVIHTKEHSRQISTNIFNQPECFRIHHEFQHDLRIRLMQLERYLANLEQIKQHTTEAIDYMFQELETYKCHLDSNRYAHLKAILKTVLDICRTTIHAI